MFIIPLFTRARLVYNETMEKASIGLLGGTFDPIHAGHIAVAVRAREALGLDRVLILPAGDPPHKHCQASAEDRLNMAQIAAAGVSGVAVSPMELSRVGKTYSIDTLRTLKAEDSSRKIVFIIGADMLFTLPTWREFKEVVKLCDFVVAGRPGQVSCEGEMRRLTQEYGARIHFLDFSGPDVSSTQVRARSAKREPILGMVPPRVEEYIRRRGLYLMNMPEAAAVEKLRQALSPHRFSHTLGVAGTAQKLAEHYRDDPAAARVAGLLHDVAKPLSLAEMLLLAKDGDADAEEKKSAALMHALAGAVIARRDYGVEDPEILHAIRMHTLGAPEMTTLEKILYVADFIEPNRVGYEGLDLARTAAEEDLDRAVFICAKLTKKYLETRNAPSHPRMFQLLEKYGRYTL